MQDLDAFLDEVVKQTAQQSLESNAMAGGKSVLAMERNAFNHKKELKQLFAKAMNAQGAKAVAGLGAEEKKQELPADMLEGYSKKMKRMILLQEKMRQKNKVLIVSKK